MFADEYTVTRHNYQDSTITVGYCRFCQLPERNWNHFGQAVKYDITVWVNTDYIKENVIGEIEYRLKQSLWPLQISSIVAVPDDETSDN